MEEDETLTSFTNWKNNNLVAGLKRDASFRPYTLPGVTWGQKTAAAPNRGYADDLAGDAIRKTAAEKTQDFEYFLEHMASFAPIVPQQTLIRNTTCLNDIWTLIKTYLGFQNTGANYLDIDEFFIKTGECANTLFQRLTDFFQKHLQQQGSGIKHHGRDPTDEDMTPALENVITHFWLKLIHPHLPALIKQEYGVQLRNRTLILFQPDIALSLKSLLSKLDHVDAPAAQCVGRSRRSGSRRRQHQPRCYQTRKSRRSHKPRLCVLCLAKEY